MNHRRGGFSLAEVVVSLAVGAILLAAAAGILMFSNRSVISYGSRMEDRYAGDGIADMVREQLEFAWSIRISEEDSGEGSALEFSRDGVFRVDGKQVFDDAYYQKRSIGCIITPKEGEETILQLELWIKDLDGTARYQKQMPVVLMNLALGGEEIQYDIETTAGVIDSADQTVVISYGADEGEDSYD